MVLIAKDQFLHICKIFKCSSFIPVRAELLLGSKEGLQCPILFPYLGAHKCKENHSPSHSLSLCTSVAPTRTRGSHNKPIAAHNSTIILWGLDPRQMGVELGTSALLNAVIPLLLQRLFLATETLQTQLQFPAAAGLPPSPFWLILCCFP